MKIDILTLFPQMFDGVFQESILKRAIESKKVEINIVNFRDYTKDPHNKVDDTPYGGGAGMVLSCQPIFDCVKTLRDDDCKVIMLTPTGIPYKQKMAYDLSKEKHLILLCGHYEGFDERVKSICDMFISIGDYILTGGEIGAEIISDSIIRLLDGVIAADSIVDESFENGLLEYPQYSEPFEYDGDYIPDILYSGNHGAIEKWRKKQSLKLTKEYRPDLLKNYPLSKQEKKLMDELESNETPKWEKDAIEKGKKFIKEK